jgi:cytochrome oxidase Cu insertion factor (SCO1/SenC/PrrC family)
MPVTPAARRGIVIFAVGLVVVAAMLIGEYVFLNAPDSSADQRLGAVEAPGKVAIGGDFTLVDQNGATRHATDFRGKLMLVYFGFTACADVCPTDLQQIGAAIDKLGRDGDAVQPLFITLDPATDTPKRLAAYVPSFHPRLIGLGGSAAAVDEAARAYRVYYKKVPGAKASEAVNHSAFIYLMDRNGKYLGFFPPGTPADRMVQVIRPYLRN